MSLPNTQKIQIDKSLAIPPGWYNAILIGHVEKDNQGIISSHIEFELTDRSSRVWAVISHEEMNFSTIKRLKEALGMKDEDTDLKPFYDHSLQVKVDNAIKDNKVFNEIKDFRASEGGTISEPQADFQPENIQRVETKKIPRYILVVDDQPEVALLIGNYVEQVGFIPDIATNVDDALRRFVPDKYLMVISDVLMPGKNGFDLVRALHNDYPDVTVALISGYYDKEMESLQKLFGIDRVYRKPVFFKSVKEMIADALKTLSAGT